MRDLVIRNEEHVRVVLVVKRESEAIGELIVEYQKEKSENQKEKSEKTLEKIFAKQAQVDKYLGAHMA